MRTPAIIAVLAAAGLTLSACGAGEPKYEGAPPADFAKATCSGWTSWQQADSDLLNLPMTLSGTGGEQKAQVVAAVDEYKSLLTAARDQVKAPAVEEGATYAAMFTDFYDSRIKLIDERMAEFESFPDKLESNNDQVQLEALDVATDIGQNGTTPGGPPPFTSIKDQDILKAFDAEPSCKDWITVIG